MTRRQQRMAAVAAVLCGAAVALGLALFALKDNVTFFMTPTALTATGDHPSAKTVRLGGMVVYGTVERSGLDVKFVVTDMQNDVDVQYRGITPDLFAEGKGVVAVGTYDGVFHATQLLAKHDENYMPPEVAKAMAATQKTPSSNGIPAQAGIQNPASLDPGLRRDAQDKQQ